MLEAMGLNEDQIAEAMEKVEEEGPLSSPSANNLWGVITNSIFVFIIGVYFPLPQKEPGKKSSKT